MPDPDDDIVLVDDDPMIAEFVQRALRETTWRLRTFDDPQAALEHLDGQTAGVLIVDTRMPGMDGPELLVRLAERGRRGGRHVFLCSASRVAETDWTRCLPPHVETIPKEVLLDRHTLVARLDDSLAPNLESAA